MTNFPIHPKHPERICWGCDKYCPADDLRCGNGTIRTEHPVELLGDDWFEWLMEKEQASTGSANLVEPAPAGIRRECDAPRE
jgi:hypothetical protein